MLSAGFSPIATPQARVLILGSLPGRVSLELQQYYAQPRNSFWRLLGQLFGFESSSSYASRVAALKRNRIALWDVCASAHRPGSLDSAISLASVTPNDFHAFLSQHRQIHTIFFNGKKAAVLFEGLVLPSLVPLGLKLTYVQLPSSSPAHASLAFDAKLRIWAEVHRANRARFVAKD
jgi:double-stranded uracil-DNA glycosylase